MIVSYVANSLRHIMRANGIAALKATKALRRAGYSVTVYPDYASNTALYTCNAGYDLAVLQEEKTEQVEKEKAKAKENAIANTSDSTVDLESVFYS